MTEYHIHANHFGEQIPARRELEDLGFRVSESVIIDAGRESLLWIVTYKANSRRELDSMVQKAVSVVKREWNGYVESEVVPSNWCREFEEMPFKSAEEFPLNPQFEYCAKAADVHVSRGLRTPYDALDELLGGKGFYEVRTPKKRIWTCLVAKPQQVKEKMDTLLRYFQRSGGICELECELVDQLIRIPEDFPMRPVAVRL
jgi:hypothetical protein